MTLKRLSNITLALIFGFITTYNTPQPSVSRQLYFMAIGAGMGLLLGVLSVFQGWAMRINNWIWDNKIDLLLIFISYELGSFIARIIGG